MHTIHYFCQQNLHQISSLIKAIQADAYTKKLPILSGSSIGQHVRHILEFYQCLLDQSGRGTVNYDLRVRDINLEEIPSFALQVIEQLVQQLHTVTIKAERLILENDFSQSDQNKTSRIPTSYSRELAYCLEHAVHHQALIKVALYDMQLAHLADKSFGVAPETLRYQNSQNS